MEEQHEQRIGQIQQWCENKLAAQQQRIARLQGVAIASSGLAVAALGWLAWLNKGIFGL